MAIFLFLLAFDIFLKKYLLLKKSFVLFKNDINVKFFMKLEKKGIIAIDV